MVLMPAFKPSTASSLVIINDCIQVFSFIELLFSPSTFFMILRFAPNFEAARNLASNSLHRLSQLKWMVYSFERPSLILEGFFYPLSPIIS